MRSHSFSHLWPVFNHINPLPRYPFSLIPFLPLLFHSIDLALQTV